MRFMYMFFGSRQSITGLTMEDEKIYDMLMEEISEDHALNSDYGGDTDAEDDPPSIMDKSSPSSQTSDKHSISNFETSISPTNSCNISKETVGSGTSKIDPMTLPPSTSGLSNSSQYKYSRLRLSRPTKESLSSVMDSDPDDSDNDPTYEPNLPITKPGRKLLFSDIVSSISSDSESDTTPHDDHSYFITRKKQKLKNTNSIGTENTNTNKHITATHVDKQKNRDNTQKNEKAKKYVWTKTSKDPEKYATYNFNQKFGLNVELDPFCPLSIFKTIIDDDICKIIVDESNRYALQNHTTLHLTLEELHAFFGILIFMGFHELPTIKSYWSSDENFHVERVSRVMTLKRFLKILRHLHLNDNEKMPERGHLDFDKLYKLRPLLDHLKAKYLVLFSPSRNLAVDESMAAFKGRTTLKQYMPMKPIKRGFKIWVCACSETGYVLNFDVYTGKKTDQTREYGLGGRVVLDLAAPFLGIGHCIYFDNFFSSIDLVHHLLEETTFTCSTIRSTRYEYPSQMKADNQLKKHEYDFFQVGDVSVVKWKDRGSKAVSVISSMSNPTETKEVLRTNETGTRDKVTCPEAVYLYNKYMGGVDKFDQHMSYYNISQKSRKWWIKLFYYFLETSIVNSFILYTLECKKRCITADSHLKFRSKLVNALISNFSSRTRRGFAPGRSYGRKRNDPDGRRTIINTVRLCNVGAHLPKKIAKYRRCAHCSTKSKEKRSNTECSSCKVALCVQCFEPFHSV